LTSAAVSYVIRDVAKRRYRYTILIVPERDRRGYYVTVPALPGCFSQGRTIEDARRNAQKAIALHVQSLRADGFEIPVEPEDAYRVAVEVAG
jgi:antitoxin HicB